MQFSHYSHVSLQSLVHSCHVKFLINSHYCHIHQNNYCATINIMTAELNVNNLVHYVDLHSQFASPDYTADDRLANQVNMYFLRIPIRCTHACTANCVCAQWAKCHMVTSLLSVTWYLSFNYIILIVKGFFFIAQIDLTVMRKFSNVLSTYYCKQFLIPVT